MMERRRRRTRTQRRRANARPQLLHLPSVNYSPAEEVGHFSPRLLQDQRARSQKDRGLVAPCSPDWQREVKGGRSIIHEAGPSGRPEGPESVWGSTVSVCLSVCVCVCVCVCCVLTVAWSSVWSFRILCFLIWLFSLKNTFCWMSHSVLLNSWSSCRLDLKCC